MATKLAFVPIFPSRAGDSVVDADGVARLDAATTRWRQPPCFVTLVGAGNAMSTAAGVLRAGGTGKVTPDDLPFAQTSGRVVVPADVPDSETSRALPINLLDAPLDEASLAVDVATTFELRTAQLAVALSFRGAIVMCVAHGENAAALERVAAAAQLSSAVRPRGFDGAPGSGACHLVILDTSPGSFAFDSTANDSRDSASPTGGAGGAPEHNYFTRLEHVSDGNSGAAARVRNAQRLVLEQAFLSVTLEAVPASEVAAGGDRFRRLVGRIVAKARAAPVTSRATQPIVSVVASRVSQVLAASVDDEAAPGGKPRGQDATRAPRDLDGADWARAAARTILDNEFVKWASVHVSTGGAAESDLQEQHAAVVTRCCALLSLWAVGATEQRLFRDAATAHLESSLKELRRRANSRAAAADHAAAGGGGVRYRAGSAGVGGARALFDRVFRLPPADEVPSCLKSLEPQVPMQHRFWLSWTGLLTIFVMVFFVVTTLLLMRKGG